MEGDLVRVQDALAVAEEAMVVAEEAKHKVEAKALTWRLGGRLSCWRLGRPRIR